MSPRQTMSLGGTLLQLLSFYCQYGYMVHISLVPTLVLMVFYVSTFRRMCAVPNMAVFCSSRTSWLPDVLPTYFPNDFEMMPVAPIITGITVVFTLLLLLLLFGRAHNNSTSVTLSILFACYIYRRRAIVHCLFCRVRQVCWK